MSINCSTKTDENRKKDTIAEMFLREKILDKFPRAINFQPNEYYNYITKDIP